MNDTEDLSGVRVGAHHEIFRANRPVIGYFGEWHLLKQMAAMQYGNGEES